MNMFKEHTANAIVLGGDLHNSFAWTLMDAGGQTGEPVAVNLGTTSVTSVTGTIVESVSDFYGEGPFDSAGGRGEFSRILNRAVLHANPSLVHADYLYRGFIAVRATKVRIQTCRRSFN